MNKINNRDYIFKIKIHKEEKDTWIFLNKKWGGFEEYVSSEWTLGSRINFGFLCIQQLPNIMRW
jgi:hypothetical protein